MVKLTLHTDQVLRKATQEAVLLETDGENSAVEMEMTDLWISIKQGHFMSGVEGMIRIECEKRGIDPRRVLG